MTAPRRVTLDMRMKGFNLPPVRSALIVGRRSPIGAKALAKALQEMMPESFEHIDVEHPAAEAILVRSSHLRVVPEDRLVEAILRHVDALMDPADIIHLEMDVTVAASEEVEL